MAIAPHVAPPILTRRIITSCRPCSWLLDCVLREMQASTSTNHNYFMSHLYGEDSHGVAKKRRHDQFLYHN